MGLLSTRGQGRVAYGDGTASGSGIVNLSRVVESESTGEVSTSVEAPIVTVTEEESLGATSASFVAVDSGVPPDRRVSISAEFRGISIAPEYRVLQVGEDKRLLKVAP